MGIQTKLPSYEDLDFTPLTDFAPIIIASLPGEEAKGTLLVDELLPTLRDDVLVLVLVVLFNKKAFCEARA